MTDEYDSLEGSNRSEKKVGSTLGSTGDGKFDPNYYSASVNIDDFHIKAVIGRGSFGKVYCVVKKDNNKVYAMKTLKKEMILKKN